MSIDIEFERESVRPPTESVPLRGYCIREEDDKLWIQDRTGIWVVSTDDVANRTEWTDAEDPRFEGEPTVVYIREGAEIHELRPYTIETGDRPITMTDVDMLPEADGYEGLIDLEREYCRHLGIDPTMPQGRACTIGSPSFTCPWPKGPWCDQDDSSCD